LTLSDNRRIDFFVDDDLSDSNLGAGEMRTLIAHPGISGSPGDDGTAKLSARISRTGIEAARRKFTPDSSTAWTRIVVFKSLGNEELRRIVDIELEMVQHVFGLPPLQSVLG